MSKFNIVGGSDILTINDRLISDFCDGDTSAITFPNDISSTKTGKNGNSIISYNSSGRIGELTLTLLLGSSDDKFLNSLHISYKKDPSAFILLSGEFIKKLGDGLGNSSDVKYILKGGIFFKTPEIKENVEGDTEQGKVVWSIRFCDCDRLIS
jgi:hypothetical protein